MAQTMFFFSPDRVASHPATVGAAVDCRNEIDLELAAFLNALQALPPLPSGSQYADCCIWLPAVSARLLGMPGAARCSASWGTCARTTGEALV